MKTIYFPFTAIDPRQAERLTGVWGPITLLQPSEDTVLPEMRRLQDNGTIDLLLPSGGGRERGLQEALAAFEQWTAQHAGSDRGTLLELFRAFPLFSKQFPAQLASDIRRGGRGSEAAATAGVQPALFEAQLVLALAQKLDSQQVELTRDIDALATAEQEMLALLKGEEGLAEEFTKPREVAPPAGATAMLALRLRAWARLVAAVPGRATSGGWPENEILFVTDAPDLPAHLNELFPEMRFRMRSRTATETGQIEAHPTDLPDWLAGADGTSGAAAARRARDAGGDLIEIPGVAPRAFLARLAAGRSGPESLPSSASSVVATWIGYHPRLSHDA